MRREDRLFFSSLLTPYSSLDSYSSLDYQEVTVYQMFPVRSSSGWVQSVGYDFDRKALYVQFRGGVRVRYANTPVSFMNGLAQTSSAGRYLHRSGLYNRPYTRV